MIFKKKKNKQHQINTKKQTKTNPNNPNQKQPNSTSARRCLVTQISILSAFSTYSCQKMILSFCNKNTAKCHANIVNLNKHMYHQSYMESLNYFL